MKKNYNQKKINLILINCFKNSMKNNYNLKQKYKKNIDKKKKLTLFF